MSTDTTTRIVELIASKICHDLISPVGAVSNGVEILEEIGADDDVTSLISFSATQASAKLKTMRLAYGMGGSDESIKLEDVHKIFDDFVSGDNRVSQNWDPHMNLGFEPHKGFAKLLTCALMMAADSLPKGGELTVTPEGEHTIVVKATGENAAFRDGVIDAFDGKKEAKHLDPKLIHPYLTSLFATKYGFKLQLEPSTDNFICLRLTQSIVD